MPHSFWIMAPKAPLECGDWSPLWRSSRWPDQAACCLEYHKPTSGRAFKRLDIKGRQAARCRTGSMAASGDESPHSRAPFGRFFHQSAAKTMRHWAGFPRSEPAVGQPRKSWAAAAAAPPALPCRQNGSVFWRDNSRVGSGTGRRTPNARSAQ